MRLFDVSKMACATATIWTEVNVKGYALSFVICMCTQSHRQSLIHIHICVHIHIYTYYIEIEKSKS